MRTKKSAPETGNRMLIIACVLVMWMLAIIGRMYWLQVVKHDHYLTRARENQQADYEMMAARGAILDRNGKDLALSVIFDSVFVDQRMLKTDEARKKSAEVLAPLLEVKEAELIKQMTGNSGFAFLARKIDPEKARAIREAVAQHGLKAIGFRKEPQRFYPNDSLAASALGFVDGTNEGQGGLERSQNKLLNGKAGEVLIERDGKNQAYERHETPAIGGATISTTLDAPMQHKIEMLLAGAVKSHSAKGAHAVVMDAATGEILALVNAPSFNPNERIKSKDEIRQNMAISAPYEPGSVFKIVTYSAAFEEGKVQINEKLNCGNGQIQFGPRIIRDTHAYGVQETPDAFAKSSNVCAIRLAQRIGKDKFYEYITRFGFGSKTGIELPAESKGIIRPADKWNFDSIGSIAIGQEISVTLIQEAAAVGVIANKGVWTQPHIVRRVVGQDGKLIYEAKPDTRQVVSAQTAEHMTALMRRVVTHGTARHAIELGNYTAAGKTGTPQKAEAKFGYTRNKFMPAFAGFVPATNPKFVIVVMVDEPVGSAHQGGSVSAPLFNIIAQIALGDFVVPPDSKGFQDSLVALSNRYESKAAEDDAKEASEFGGAGGIDVQAQTAQTQPQMQSALPPKSNTSNVMTSQNVPPNATAQTPKQKASPTPKPELLAASVTMPDLRGKGIRSVIQTCNQLNLNLKPVGSGVAVKQWPAPGTRVRPGEDCKVEFQ
ncbi:MAG: penicillin-binding protein [Blastocatellia bacterium]